MKSIRAPIKNKMAESICLGDFEQPVSAEGSSIKARSWTLVRLRAVRWPHMTCSKKRTPNFSSAFGAWALAASLVMGLTLLISASYVSGFTPEWVGSLSGTTNLGIFVGIMA